MQASRIAFLSIADPTIFCRYPFLFPNIGYLFSGISAGCCSKNGFIYRRPGQEKNARLMPY